MFKKLRDMSKRDQKKVKGNIVSEYFTTSKIITLGTYLDDAGDDINARICLEEGTAEHVPYRYSEHRPCILNFGNHKAPGINFPNGGRTQEEELLRKFPELFRSLSDTNYYPINFDKCTVIVTDYNSRWRTDNYKLTKADEKYNAMFVTAPAPNHTDHPFDEYDFLQYIRNVILAPIIFSNKSRKKHHRPTILILGGWGCGVFKMGDECYQQYIRPNLSRKFKSCKNYVELIACMFKHVLVAEVMYKYYEKTIIAIPEPSVMKSFSKVFHSRPPKTKVRRKHKEHKIHKNKK